MSRLTANANPYPCLNQAPLAQDGTSSSGIFWLQFCTHTHTHTEVETCPLSSLYCHWFQSESLIQHFLNHLKLSTMVVSELLAYYCQSILLCQLAVQAEEGRVYHSLGPSGSAGLGNGMIGSRDEHRVMFSSSAGCGWRSHHALRLSQCNAIQPGGVAVEILNSPQLGLFRQSEKDSATYSVSKG